MTTRDKAKLVLIAIIGASAYLSDVPNLNGTLLIVSNVAKHASLPTLLWLCDVPVFAQGKMPVSILEHKEKQI